MHRIMVAGIGTEVGKTVVSAILTTLLNGDYWKPIQCGDPEHSDTAIMKQWIDIRKHTIFNPAYSLEAPLSPHHAARLENIEIDLDSISLPQTERPLIIEGVGGILVPINLNITCLDVFKNWNCQWIIVSRHYLGSINHTLLTVSELKKHSIPILGIIFNGDINADSESSILEITQLPFLGRLYSETRIDQETIQKYAKLWQPQCSTLLP